MFDNFADYLTELGLEQSTIVVYLNAVKKIMKAHSKAPWMVLDTRKLSKRTKVLYRSALKRWAEYTEDEALLETLESRKISKLITIRGQKPPKRVLGLSTQEVDCFMAELSAYKSAEVGEEKQRVDTWIWPTLSLMVKLALRAQVDLTWISREAVEEALRNRSTLTLISKGGKERDVPCGHVLEELELLHRQKRWRFIADLISPGAAEPNAAAYEKIRRCMKRIARDAGLDAAAVHTHRFRHSAARWILQRAVADQHLDPIELVRQTLGHSSRRTTEIYLQVDLSGEVGKMLSRRFG